MLNLLNRLFVGFLLTIALLGIAVSILLLGLNILLGSSGDFSYMNQTEGLFVDNVLFPKYANESPYLTNLTIHTPILTESSLLTIEVYSDGRFLSETDCLYDLYPEEYIGLTQINCTVPIPYNYDEKTSYQLFAIYSETEDYVSDPLFFHLDWSNYEKTFWNFSTTVFFILLGWYVVIIVPIAFIILNLASNNRHKSSFPGEYSIRSMFHPFANNNTTMQKFYSFLTSPYFWAFELVCILLILFYMVLSAEIWKSPSAFIGFVISGMAAFIIPFLWCAGWWYADFKEREPVRVLVTLFFWGMVSALMAIGINSIAGIAFGIFGLGFLSTFLVAPIIEETYKGTGLALLSEYHEFDSIEDGIVFGFVIGMGFAFIENWIYFMDTSISSDIVGWISLFVLRSILFSASHGVYTAITGAVIAFFITRGFKAPGLGILIGMPIAALFHMMHNSGEIITMLFGSSGILVYCCFFAPLFDYGGILLIFLLFIRAIFTKRRKPPIPQTDLKPPKPKIRANVKR